MFSPKIYKPANLFNKYMKLVDVHAHLDFKPLSDHLAVALENAKSVGVKAIVANGVSPESNRAVQALAHQHDIVKPAFGFYPWHIPEYEESILDEELDFMNKHNPVAIGEVGLDFKQSEFNHYKTLYSDFEKVKLVQKQGFEKLISIAEKKKIPIIVHSRKAELETIEMLESSSAKKVIMHCFMGKKKLIPRIVDNGWTFSIPVVVTKLQQMQELVGDVPLSQLLTETDAPYLGPSFPAVKDSSLHSINYTTSDGAPLTSCNESANVLLSIKKMAELKGLTENEIADQIFLNYMRLF